MNLRERWCDWFHGGGTIKRDPYGRVNWQCGRWGEPVDKQTERLVTDAALREKAK
jgi:hypothetical protein